MLRDEAWLASFKMRDQVEVIPDKAPDRSEMSGHHVEQRREVLVAPSPSCPLGIVSTETTAVSVYQGFR